MLRYENRDSSGNLIDAFIVTDQTMKDDPDAVLKSRAPKKSRAPSAPEGYDFLATLDGDADALVADCAVHIFAKKGKYDREKPSKLAGLKAVVAEAKKEEPSK